MSLVVTTMAAVATIWRVLSSLTWNWCLGPQAVAVTVPWNWKASELWSTLFWRTSTLPVTASTTSVYAEALPPWTSITLASKTGRTEPSARGRARRRAICCWGRPATLKLVHPDVVATSEILSALTSRPTFFAASSQAAVGVRVGAGADPVARESEEETNCTLPAPMPTVTRPPTAGASEPNFWRNSTARAGESANGWSLTTSRASTSEAESPSRVAFDLSQPRAAATGAPVAAPRDPVVGAIVDGVPREFQRTLTADPSAPALPSWAVVGATVPRTSRSSRPAGVSP